ncbi:MAG: IS91 family transposase [Treponema sp.]|nr:IS91 family transposase [Treponema sp.]
MIYKVADESGELQDIDYPIRTIFRKFLPYYVDQYQPSPEQLRAANLIAKCKTGELGYNVSTCSHCGNTVIHACSCKNRNCPSCQYPQEKKWIMERNAELVEGLAYYHVIFTIPDELNPLVYANQKLLYGLLSKTASETLLQLCRQKKYMGATPGIITVLHTWGQKLNFHPHLHAIQSGGGLTDSGQFVETRHKGFIIPVEVLGSVFRGKFMFYLKKFYSAGKLVFPDIYKKFAAHDKWKAFVDKLYKKTWCPFIKETFNGKGNAIEYLARYSYRTAISNSRIIQITDTTVTFSYKDYADENKTKYMTVTGDEFLHLFLQHVLPKRFHRVRFTGYLANGTRTKNMKHICHLRGKVYETPFKGLNNAELLLALFQIDISVCSKCGHEMTSERTKHPPESLLA